MSKSGAYREKILSRTSLELDTLQDKPNASNKWRDVDGKGLLPYNHTRLLPKKTAKKAIDYIDVLVRGYPFQLRYAMAIPLWERFAQEWCDTGNEESSLRVI